MPKSSREWDDRGVVVAAYTDEYREIAFRAHDAFRMLGVPILIAHYDNTVFSYKKWMRNTLLRTYRAFVLATKEGWFGRKFVWVLDADVIPKKDPIPFFQSALPTPWRFDVAAPNPGGPREDMEWSAGVVGFAPTPAGMATWAIWAGMCGARANEDLSGVPDDALPEQALLLLSMRWALGQRPDGGGALYDEFSRLQPIARVYRVGQRYAGRPGDVPPADAVMIHDPASRTMKGVVDAAV